MNRRPAGSQMRDAQRIRCSLAAAVGRLGLRAKSRGFHVVGAMRRCDAGEVPDFGMRWELAARPAQRWRYVVPLAAGLVALIDVVSTNGVAAASVQPLASSQVSCPQVLMSGGGWGAEVKDGRSCRRSTRTFPNSQSRSSGLLKPYRAPARLDRWPR